MTQDYKNYLATTPEPNLQPKEREDKLDYLLTTNIVKKKVLAVAGDIDASKKLIATIGQISDMYSVQSCTLESVIDSAIMIHGLGLSPIPELGETYIIGYKGKNGQKTAKPDISFKGWKKIAKEQGIMIDAEGVFNGLDIDDFEDAFKFNYRTKVKAGDVAWVKANLTGVIVKIHHIHLGYTEFKHVDVTTLDKIKAVSPSVKANKQSPYDDWYYEMIVLAKAIKYIAKKEIQFNERALNAISMLYKSDAVVAEDIKEPKKIEVFSSLKDIANPQTGEIIESDVIPPSE